MAKCFENAKSIGISEDCAAKNTYPSHLIRKSLLEKIDPCLVFFLGDNFLNRKLMILLIFNVKK